MLLIGCCGNTESYSQIANMGYDYIELSARQIMTLSETEFQDFLQKYRKTGFPCRCFNDFCSINLPIIGPNCNLSAIKQYADCLCLRGHALGIQSIGIGAPAARVLPGSYPAERADQEMESFLRCVAGAASKYGIMILVEAVHKYLCNYMNQTEDALAMVKRVNLPNVAMVLDYYHAFVMGEDIHQFSDVMPYVRHLHISTDLQGHYRGFLTAEDTVKLTQLLREAVANGYQGAISVEAAPDCRLEPAGELCADVMRTAVSCM